MRCFAIVFSLWAVQSIALILPQPVGAFNLYTLCAFRQNAFLPRRPLK